jgi:hypothetical protein
MASRCSQSWAKGRSSRWLDGGTRRFRLSPMSAKPTGFARCSVVDPRAHVLVGLGLFQSDAHVGLGQIEVLGYPADAIAAPAQLDDCSFELLSERPTRTRTGRGRGRGFFLSMVSLLDIPTAESSESANRHRTRLTADDAIHPSVVVVNHRIVRDGRTIRAGRRKLLVRWLNSAHSQCFNSRVDGGGLLQKCRCLRAGDSLRPSINGKMVRPGRPNSTPLLELKMRVVKELVGPIFCQTHVQHSPTWAIKPGATGDRFWEHR